MWHEHKGEMNRLALRDKVNKAFEEIFAKTIAQMESDRGKSFSEKEIEVFRKIAWEEYQKELKK